MVARTSGDKLDHRLAGSIGRDGLSDGWAGVVGAAGEGRDFGSEGGLVAPRGTGRSVRSSSFTKTTYRVYNDSAGSVRYFHMPLRVASSTSSAMASSVSLVEAKEDTDCGATAAAGMRMASSPFLVTSRNPPSRRARRHPVCRSRTRNDLPYRGCRGSTTVTVSSSTPSSGRR